MRSAYLVHMLGNIGKAGSQVWRRNRCDKAEPHTNAGSSVDRVSKHDCIRVLLIINGVTIQMQARKQSVKEISN